MYTSYECRQIELLAFSLKKQTIEIISGAYHDLILGTLYLFYVFVDGL